MHPTRLSGVQIGARPIEWGASCDRMRFHYGDDVTFICGYEAGCLGYTLYHQLTSHHVKCMILAQTSMPTQKGKKKVKTDKRDAQKINTAMSRPCQEQAAEGKPFH